MCCSKEKGITGEAEKSHCLNDKEPTVFFPNFFPDRIIFFVNLNHVALWKST